MAPCNPENSVILLTELHYHPPAALFAELLRADGILLEAHEHYRKQTYRNFRKRATSSRICGGPA